MKPIKLITSLDRINYFSDNYIQYYKNFFKEEEFLFMLHIKKFRELVKYLKQHGFSDQQFMTFNVDKFGWGDNSSLQNRVKKEMLNIGHTVLYADVDERIFHPQLRDYIREHPVDLIAPTGISLMRHPDEPPLDKTKKVLEQRSYGKIDKIWFSKVCILNKDFHWTPGRHNKPLDFKISDDIYLVDIGKMCEEFMLENNEQTRLLYTAVTQKYKTDKKEGFQKIVDMEHKGPLIPLPEIIKNSMLF